LEINPTNDPTIHKSIMSSTLRLLTLISYISFQFSATNAAENWTGCVDKNKPDALLETNKETPVCFTIGPSGDWAIQTEFLRYAFKPVADEYSKLTLPGCKGIILAPVQ
jgi:hypothetical protein